MKIVIQGATGPLGSACARHLASLGHRVACVARDPGRLDRLQASCDHRLELIPGDLADKTQRGAVHARLEAFLAAGEPAAFLFALGAHRDSPPGGDETTARELVETNLTLPMLEALHFAPRLVPGSQMVFFADATVQIGRAHV